MAAVDFPNSPTTNQVFTSGNIQFQWDGAKWASGSLTGFAPATNPAGGIANYAPIASPTFTGTVTIPAGASIAGYAPIPNPIGGASNYAPIASPTFTGTVTIPSGASIGGFTGNLSGPSYLSTTVNYTTDYAIGANLTTGILSAWGANSANAAWLSAGAYYNGSAFVATLTAPAHMAFGNGLFAFNMDTGLTVGNTYTPTQRFSIDTTHATFNVPILTTTAGAQAIAIGPTLATPYFSISGASNGSNIAQGAYLNGTSWIATQTTASIITQIPTGIAFYFNGGLTVGAAFTPSVAMQWQSSTGYFIAPQLVAPAWVMGTSYTTTYWNWQPAQASGSLAWLNQGTGQWYMRASDWLAWNPTGVVGGNGAYVNISDIRTKVNVLPESRGLDIIKQLNPIGFVRRTTPDKSLLAGRPEIGFSAQEIQILLPEVVIKVGTELSDGSGGMDSDEPMLGIQETGLIPILVNAIKQLERRLATVEGKN